MLQQVNAPPVNQFYLYLYLFEINKTIPTSRPVVIVVLNEMFDDKTFVVTDQMRHSQQLHQSMVCYPILYLYFNFNWVVLATLDLFGLIELFFLLYNLSLNKSSVIKIFLYKKYNFQPKVNFFYICADFYLKLEAINL